MSLNREPQQCVSFRHVEPIDHFIDAKQLGDLTQIYNDGINGCQFSTAANLATKVFSQRMMHSLTSISISERLSKPEDIFQLKWSNFHHLPGFDAWLQCIHHWTDVFQCLFDAKSIGMRVQRLDRAMCPKFHVDNLAVRLVMTFSGGGTEWLPNRSADRSKLGIAGAGKDDNQSGIIQNKADIQSVPEGAVILLKGEGWEGNEGNGLIHRSPTVPDSTSRFIFTLDRLADD